MATAMVFTGSTLVTEAGLALNNPGGTKPLFLSSKASTLALAAAPPPSSCTFGDLATLGTTQGMASTAFSPNSAYVRSLSNQGRLSVAPAGNPLASVFAAMPAISCTGPFTLNVSVNTP